MGLLGKFLAKQNKNSSGDSIQAMMPIAGGNEVVATGNVSSAFSSNVVRLLCETNNARVRFGSNPSAADNTDILIIAGIPEYFSVNPGEKLYVDGDSLNVTNFTT